MRHCALKGLFALAIVGMSAESGAWSYLPTPFGMSERERQRIENEESVRYNYRRNREQKGETALERLSKMDRANFRRMCGADQEYDCENQAKALEALILLGALCEKAQEEQERQKAIEKPKQEERSKTEDQVPPKVSGRQAATPPEHEDEESTGAGVWLVLVLLGGAGVYVIYGELKHRSGSRGKPLPRLRRPNIVCPHCGCVYEYDPELIGVTVQCGSCNQEFVAQKPV